ncbi:MAG: fibronectin type III domain-containing protein, partial [Polaribacter sp.]|nr:fibronectin type III domain-containing protein [Polaribacter sp.]
MININVEDFFDSQSTNNFEIAIYKDNNVFDAGFSEFELVKYIEADNHIVDLLLTDLEDNTVYYIQVQSHIPKLNFAINITEYDPPYVLSNSLTLTLDENGQTFVTPEMLITNTRDKCRAASLSFRNIEDNPNIVFFDCNAIGPTFYLRLGENDDVLNYDIASLITVRDNTPPIVRTQNIDVYLDVNGQAKITYEQVNNGTSDNCNTQSYAFDIDIFDCSNIGENIITLSAADKSGNLGSNTATVSVYDNMPPTVITQDITVYLGADGRANITPDQINNNSTDNCSIVSYALDVDSFDCTNIGSNTVVALTVTDTSGNKASKTATVTVLDNITPIVKTQDIDVFLDANGKARIAYEQVNNGTSDNCNIQSYAFDVSTFDCSNIGVNIITLSAADKSGNLGSNTATVSVYDNMLPTVITQDITVYLDVNNQAKITPNQINNNSTDNCGIASYVLDVDSFDCTNIGENTVTLTLTDNSNNMASKTAKVTVLETVLPTVITQDITVHLDEDLGSISILANQIDDGSIDNCGIASYTLNVSDFNCTDAGENTVTLTVTDTSGNIGTGTATVTVLEKKLPTIQTQSIEITLDSNGQASITPQEIDNGSTDNCGIVSYVLDIDSFNCANIGENTVTLTVTDGSGNKASKTEVVTIINNGNPNVCCLYSIPLVENFDVTAKGDASNSNAPKCWSFIADDSGYACVFNDYSNNYYINHFVLSNTSNTGDFMLISPKLPDLNTIGASINFRLKGYDIGTQFQIGTMSDPTDASTFVLIETLTYNSSYPLSYTDFSQEIKPTPNNYFAIRLANNTVSNNIVYIDDIVVEQPYFKPENLQTSNLTASSVNLSWDASPSETNGYEWVIMPSEGDLTPISDSYIIESGFVNTGTTSITIPNLDPLTSYKAFVRALYASDGKTKWSNYYSFSTFASVPFFEGFESSPIRGSSNSNAPNYWSYIAGDEGTTGVVEYYAKTGSKSYEMYNGLDVTGNYMLVSPGVEKLTSGGIQVNFSARGLKNNFIEVGTLTNLNEPSTFTLKSTLYFTLDNSYEDFSVNILESSDSYFAIRHGQNTARQSFYLDDFNVVALPCVTPENLTVSNIIGTTATLSWQASINEINEYQWIVMNKGEAPSPDNAIVTGVVNTGILSANVSGLTNSTMYDVYIRTVCNSNNFSNWSSVVSYTTLACDTQSLPYAEDFESGFDGTCWTLDGASLKPKCGVNQTNYLIISPGSNLIETPPIDASNKTSIMAIFDIGLYCNSSFNSSDIFDISYWNGVEWVLLQKLNTASLNYTLSNLSFIITEGLTQNFKIKISGANTYYGQGVILIDNLRILETPSCIWVNNVSVSNITHTGIDVTWDASETETNGYEWIVMENGIEPNLVNAVTSGSVGSSITSAAISNLESNTDYNVYVRSVCNDNFSDWSLKVLFRSLPTPPVNDNSCNATSLTLGEGSTGSSYTTLGATAQVGEPNANLNGGINGSVWFNFVAPSTGTVQISTDIEGGTLIDTEVAIYSVADCEDFTSFIQLGFAQHGGKINFKSAVLLTSGLTTGETYYIQVDTPKDVKQGTFGLEVNEIEPPINDDVCDAISLTFGSVVSGETFTNLGATAQAGEPDANLEGGINGSVWFSFVAPSTGTVQISTDIEGGTLIDTEVAIYSVADCEDFTSFTQIG